MLLEYAIQCSSFPFGVPHTTTTKQGNAKTHTKHDDRYATSVHITPAVSIQQCPRHTAAAAAAAAPAATTDKQKHNG